MVLTLEQPQRRTHYEVEQETVLNPDGQRELRLAFRFPQDKDLLTRRKCPQCQGEFGLAGKVAGSSLQICPYCGYQATQERFHTPAQVAIIQQSLDKQDFEDRRYAVFRHGGILAALLVPNKSFRWKSLNYEDQGHAMLARCQACGNWFGINALAPHCPYCQQPSGVAFAVTTQGYSPPAYTPALLEAGIENGKMRAGLIVLTMPIWLLVLAGLLAKGCS